MGPALIVLTWLILSFISWRRWTDPLIDFGRELYTAWQLAEGRTLYRDVEHLYGPLSAYWNAGLFRLCGVSYTVLTVANLTLLAGFTALLHGLWKRLTDAWTAVWICLGFLAVSAFAMYDTAIANYNFITPYAHELVHGFYLSIFTLAALTAYARKPRVQYLFLAGILYGLVFLTKSEVFFALTFAIAVYVLAGFLSRRISPKGAVILWACLVAGGTVSVVGLYLAIGLRLPFPEYLQGIGRQYSLGLNPDVSHNLFYLSLLGFDRPGEHLLDAARAAATIGLVLAVFHGLGRWRLSAWSQRQRRRPWLPTVAGLAVAGAMGLWDWHYFACLLPAVLAGALILELIGSQGAGRATTPPAHDGPAARPWDQRAGWVLWLGFGLGMLLKSGLNPLFIHYGFCLSAAGLMCVIALLTYRIPALYSSGPRASMRLWLVALVVVGMLRLTGESVQVYARRHYVVGERAGDLFRVLPPEQDPRGRLANETAAWLAAHLPPTTTLAVIPEGVMLNYQTRRVNPTPFINFIPMTLAAYGEERMLAAYQAHPPDYIVVFDRDLSEFGLPRFGTPHSPGAGFMRWIERHYVPAKEISLAPALTIYRRRVEGAGVP